MAVKEINPQEAHDLLKAGTGWVYIDVRTVTEFSAGHPDGAVNIPVAIPDPARGMALNESFTQVVQAHPILSWRLRKLFIVISPS